MRPVVTEQTAKRFKGLMVLGILLAIVGGVVAAASDDSKIGLLVMSGGAIAFLYAKFAAWWNHG
ncbi:hypothetical protein D9M71_34100 [compost metagenome]